MSSGILEIYVKWGDMKEAYVAFSDIGEPDDVNGTTMISGCVKNGNKGWAFALYTISWAEVLKVVTDDFILASLAKTRGIFFAWLHIHVNVLMIGHM